MKYIGISAILLVAIGGFLWVFNNKSQVFYSDKKNQEINNKTNDEVNDENIEQNDNKVDSKPDNEEKISKIESENILESGKKIKIIYEEQYGVKNITDIICEDGIKYNISPEKDEIVISDSISKDIYLLDLQNNLKKVTNKQYISTDNLSYKKEDVMRQNKNYLWIDEAAFIDEKHIAYSSALPWINKSGKKYLWIYNIDTNAHKGYYKINGNEFTFGELSSDRLEISIDGKKVYVDYNGKILP